MILLNMNLRTLKVLLHRSISFGASMILLFLLFPAAIFIRMFYSRSNKLPRLVWGSTPIINNSYWSRAMRNAGFISETASISFFKTINKRGDWDRIISEEYKLFPTILKPYLAFVHSLFIYDIYFISFDGFFIGATPLKYTQSFLLKLAKKKVVVIPFGSDSYVYRDVKSTTLLHGLLMSYPEPSRRQADIARGVDYWVRKADAVLPGIMGPDGFGRWDTIIPSTLFIDLEQWKASDSRSLANGKDQKVVIVHAPNHRGFKGSEFIFDAIQKLKAEGLNVELKVLEKLQNDEVRRILREDADILVEQIIATGHGMNGLEGMASGLPTISNLEDESYMLPLRRWSYFGECPLVSATPENLVDVLRKLVTRPELRHQLGDAGRAYVEKYHGLDSAQYLFTNVIEYVYGRKESLINLYHPLLGEYPNRSPKIQHPLNNNRIGD